MTNEGLQTEDQLGETEEAVSEAAYRPVCAVVFDDQRFKGVEEGAKELIKLRRAPRGGSIGRRVDASQERRNLETSLSLARGLSEKLFLELCNTREERELMAKSLAETGSWLEEQIRNPGVDIADVHVGLEEQYADDCLAFDLDEHPVLGAIRDLVNDDALRILSRRFALAFLVPQFRSYAEYISDEMEDTE